MKGANEDQRLKNAQFRGESLLFLRAEPISAETVTLLFSVTLRPLRRFLTKQLTLAATEHDTLQWGALAEDSSEMGFGALLQKADWPITHAATGDLDKEFANQLAHNHAPAVYTRLPPKARDLSTRHTVFRLLSRQGCYFRKHISRPHELPHFQIFRVLVDVREFRQLLETTCQSIRSAYVQAFLKHYSPNGEDLSRAGLLELLIVAVLGKTTTVFTLVGPKRVSAKP